MATAAFVAVCPTVPSCSVGVSIASSSSSVARCTYPCFSHFQKPATRYTHAETWGVYDLQGDNFGRPEHEPVRTTKRQVGAGVTMQHRSLGRACGTGAATAIVGMFNFQNPNAQIDVM